MPEFDKNAGFLWAIIILGLAIPAVLSVFAIVRVRLAKRRLERLEASEDR